MSAARTASLSLDLDNLWAYQMTHGDPGWETLPSYLDVVVPTALELLDGLGLTITFFVVGADATVEANRPHLRSLADAGHEIGNHSMRHQPWLHRYSDDELVTELAGAEDALAEVTGQRPVGFRGPGYSLSPSVLRVLAERGYRYDASTLPTVIGPLARAYYFRSAKLTAAQREERSYLFGSWRDGLRQLKPYHWDVGGRRLLEIPVTTMPLARVPIHLSYVLYLGGVSPAAGRQYFRSALAMCKARGVEPSILLHPLDVVGADDVAALEFFPGMNQPSAPKRELVRQCLADLAERYDVVTMQEHAARIEARGGLRVVSASKAEVAA